MRVVVIIPTLNEAGSVAQVVAHVPRDSVGEVIVVDNGSTDGTGGVAQAAGARVVREDRRGYGYACAAGVAAAGDGVDVLVFMDGDGSNDPAQISDVVAPITCCGADLVLGSRVLGAPAYDGLLPHQRWGNSLSTTLVGLLYHQRITDLPPLKAIKRSVLAALDMSEMSYGWTVEMIVKCAKQGYVIHEVPVTSRPRTAGQSKVSGTVRGTILAAYYLLTTTVKHAWRG